MHIFNIFLCAKRFFQHIFTQTKEIGMHMIEVRTNENKKHVLEIQNSIVFIPEHNAKHFHNQNSAYLVEKKK